MSDFVHQRHQPPVSLCEPRPLVLATAPLRSKVNLSRIVRAAGCSGVQRIVVCGSGRIDRDIARDAAEQIEIEPHRSLPPVLSKLQREGYCLVGLEQATNSHCLYDFQFPHRMVLVIGNERQGLTADVLSILDHVVEIPVYGPPCSFNAATAAAIAMYEYCRQFPSG